MSLNHHEAETFLRMEVTMSDPPVGPSISVGKILMEGLRSLHSPYTRPGQYLLAFGTLGTSLASPQTQLCFYVSGIYGIQSK